MTVLQIQSEHKRLQVQFDEMEAEFQVYLQAIVSCHIPTQTLTSRSGSLRDELKAAQQARDAVLEQMENLQIDFAHEKKLRTRLELEVDAFVVWMVDNVANRWLSCGRNARSARARSRRRAATQCSTPSRRCDY